MEVSTISNYELGNDELMHYGVLGMKLERKSQKLGYKAAKTKLKMTKYLGGDVGSKSLNYLIKSDAFAAKAAKARMRIANNKSYIAATKRKISKITPEDISGAYSFVNELLKSA